jgi:predicted SprT family Zn-dependent metalloprotease
MGSGAKPHGTPQPKGGGMNKIHLNVDGYPACSAFVTDSKNLTKDKFKVTCQNCRRKDYGFG